MTPEAALLAAIGLYLGLLLLLRPALVSPAVAVPAALIFDSLGTLYLADAGNFIDESSAATERRAALFSLLCIAALLGGIAAAALRWRLRQAAAAPFALATGSPSAGSPLLLFAMSAAFGCVYAAITAGSLGALAAHLNVRQTLSAGHSWPLFFVEAASLAWCLLYLRGLDRPSGGMPRSGLWAALLVTLVWFGLLGGRLFAVQFLLQVYVVQRFARLKSPRPRAPAARRFLAGAALLAAFLLIVLVYGFFRVGQDPRLQGAEDGGLGFLLWLAANLDSTSDFIAGFLIDVFFDGWYVLLRAIDSTDICSCHTYGAATLGALFKIAPGVYGHVVDPILQFSGNEVYVPGQIGERTVSLLATEYIEFGFGGAWVFAFLGYGLQAAWQTLHAAAATPGSNRNGAVLIGFVYAAILVNTLAMIRSGPAVGFTWFYATVFWLLAYLGLRGSRLRLPAAPPVS